MHAQDIVASEHRIVLFILVPFPNPLLESGQLLGLDFVATAWPVIGAGVGFGPIGCGHGPLSCRLAQHASKVVT